MSEPALQKIPMARARSYASQLRDILCSDDPKMVKYCDKAEPTGELLYNDAEVSVISMVVQPTGGDVPRLVKRCRQGNVILKSSATLLLLLNEEKGVKIAIYIAHGGAYSNFGALIISTGLDGQGLNNVRQRAARSNMMWKEEEGLFNYADEPVETERVALILARLKLPPTIGEITYV